MHLTILYRGSLISCNYGCEYCPFAKRQQTAAELAIDKQSLERFVNWISQHPQHQFSILFTPWGEALIHSWYQQALIKLTQLPNVNKAAIQTNLSCNLDWVEECNKDKLALWATFHSEWVSRDRFLQKCLNLDNKNIKFSVGVVGFPKFQAEIAALRQELPNHVYLWINAVKAELPNLSPADREFFQSIDPLYELNTNHYPSFGYSCRAGKSAISVDGDGTMRRCHFIKEPIGNIYDSDWEAALVNQPCSNQSCHCHIGYVHLEYLKMNQVFGSGILERIPDNWVYQECLV
ncbi:STM4011 family radical SAM protein [Nostoc sp. 'Peltigera membranacea cyanobiont' 232]|uniref:STM4011 family radical SAM protein n=1 Tax=Nostoc sp. 'Peltigera membranacea cyanobiont' 232 TaxID=2014531 RepID=UPI000B955058|nr:STM4011 family radical SAM protein [Nostoc sp. 'Peltigera membranacea cyanobiont' 232]OYE03972.1 radical SAM protein [Nostoc sp. 'Peltigera membranacea cyanobiont' 232]